VPGFIDAHSHPSYAGIRHLRWVDCNLRSLAAIQDAIRARAANTPPGDWVVGSMYYDTKTSEGRKLTREDLDAAAPNHPVFIEHRGGHTAYVNSLAYRRTEITDQIADPPGGKFDRDPATGKLSGGLRENATDPFQKILHANFTRDEMRQGVKLMFQMMVRTGVTSVTDAQASPADLLGYQDAREAGELSLRVYCLMQYAALDKMIAAGVRAGLGDEWVRVGGIKLVCDGSISERTARLTEPYVGRPTDYGILVSSEEELYARARKAREAGWQIGTHANGDAAIDIMLRIYEKGGAAPRSALSPGTLHGGESVADRPDSRAGRHPHAVLDLRVLSRREDEGIRAGALELDVRGTQFSGRRHSRHAGVRLPARTFRADDGAAIGGHTHGQPRHGLGTAAASDRRGSAAGRRHERRVRLVRGKSEGQHHGGQAGRSGGAGPRSPARRSYVANRDSH
jgi:hypothetical protein